MADINGDGNPDLVVATGPGIDARGGCLRSQWWKLSLSLVEFGSIQLNWDCWRGITAGSMSGDFWHWEADSKTPLEGIVVFRSAKERSLAEGL